MRLFRLAIFLIVLTAASTGYSYAQALVKKDFNWFLTTRDGIYPAVNTMAVFTPSGNILHKQVFIVDKDDSIVPERGTSKIAFKTWVYYEGLIWIMIDAEGQVYPDGRVFLVFHTNGAGSTTPPKKFGSD